jgi:hypothetical protein
MILGKMNTFMLKGKIMLYDNSIEKELIKFISTTGSIQPFLLNLREMAHHWGLWLEEFNVVELGVSIGASTTAFLSGLNSSSWNFEKLTGKSPKHHLYSCDIISGLGNLKLFEDDTYMDRWSFFDVDSVSFADMIPDVIPDVVFIDTDHTYDTTTKELEVWSGRLIEGGRILLHDTYKKGVHIPIKEFLEKNEDWGFYDIGVSCGLGVLTKPGSYRYYDFEPHESETERFIIRPRRTIN